jgi:hypothetical protein
MQGDSKRITMKKNIPTSVVIVIIVVIVAAICGVYFQYTNVPISTVEDAKRDMEWFKKNKPVITPAPPTSPTAPKAEKK